MPNTFFIAVQGHDRLVEVDLPHSASTSSLTSASRVEVNALVSHSQRMLDRDPAAPEFRRGQVEGQWRIMSQVCPHVVIVVPAAPRPNSPAEFGLQFECSGYPHQAVTAQPSSRVDWFNHRRLLAPIVNIPPVEAEQRIAPR